MAEEEVTEEQLQARARLRDWARGFEAGYRGERRIPNQGSFYLMGYRAGRRNAQPVEPLPIPRAARRRKVAA